MKTKTTISNIEVLRRRVYQILKGKVDYEFTIAKNAAGFLEVSLKHGPLNPSHFNEASSLCEQAQSRLERAGIDAYWVRNQNGLDYVEVTLG
jgi:hypothetical protein